MMKKKGRRIWFYLLASVAALMIFTSDLRAEMQVDFHGYLETNIVMRDENGMQYGFLDHLNAVQQRNTLKFDVDVHPQDMDWGDLKFNKVHLTYRGAYDSIYDLRANKFGDVSEKGGPTRFDYGLRDVRFENDLRELSMDFSYNGPLGSGFFRPGRQIVSWGEASPAATLLDVINPADNSYQMFFQNPDDLKTPLWMGRLNYSLPRMSSLALNVDLLWIPDIRPTQFGPLDSVAGNPTAGMNAPYVAILPFAGLRGMNVREEVPTQQQEYGAKLLANIGERLSVSAVYFHDVINDPGLEFRNITNLPGPPFLAPGTAVLTHGTRNVWGGMFSYQFEPLDMIIRGEYSHYTDAPINLPAASPDLVGTFTFPGGIPNAGVDGKLVTYRMKPVNKWMLAFDKNMMVKWLAPHQNSTFSFEWVRTQIQGWESIFDSTTAKTQDLFELTIMAQWFEGRLNPQFFAAYIPGHSGDGGGTGMLAPSITWIISPHLYTKAAMQVFLGDKDAGKSGFAGFVNTVSEVTLKLGYEW